MSTRDTPPPPPAPEATADGPPRGADDGPRVSGEEVRDLGRLRRSRSDRKIAGVAGGLARHLDIDPVITRVLLVVLAFFGGAGLILYAVAWLVVPVEGTDEAPVRLDERSRVAALVVAGALALLSFVGDSVGGWDFPWPVAVVGVLVLLVLLSRGGPRVHPLVPGPVAPIDPLAGTATGPPPATRADDGAAPAYVPPTAWKPPRSDRRRGPVLFWYALALAAIGVGVLGTAQAAGADVADSAYPALVLGTCAVLLVVGAFWGRAGGLVALGLVAALVTAAATAADELDTGRLETTPTSAAGVQDRYDLAFGAIDLDLSQVADLDALDGRTVEVEVEVAGRAEIVVPQGLDVVVRSHLDAGERRIFGETYSDDDLEDRMTTADGGLDAPELVLDVAVRFGEIEISREAS